METWCQPFTTFAAPLVHHRRRGKRREEKEGSFSTEPRPNQLHSLPQLGLDSKDARTPQAGQRIHAIGVDTCALSYLELFLQMLEGIGKSHYCATTCLRDARPLWLSVIIRVNEA